MPHLVDTPQDVKQITDYLADGNTAMTPAVTGADINDGDLLNATRTVELGSGYKFEITLPSGRVLESAPVGNDYPKRDAMLQWLDAVRGSIVEDAAAAGRATRDAHMLEARARDLAEPVGADPARAVVRSPAGSGQNLATDPVEYAKQQLRAALERLAALAGAESDVAKWQKVVLALTGVVVEPTKRKKRRKKREHKQLPI